MNDTDTFGKELQQLLESMTGQPEGGEGQTPGQDEQQMQDMYVLVVRESADADDPPEYIVEATVSPPKTEKREPIDPLLCATGIFFLILILSSLLFQVYMVLNPPIATVTIVPKSQSITLQETLQLGRLVSSITISQEATAPTTGKGHQDAKQARGTITFYNGQLNSVTVPAGTMITASNGVQIITDQDVTIPALDTAANPPTVGQRAVSAHAINPGGRGNIPAFDINQPCCSASIIAKNVTPFTGGQDTRNFQTVARRDIDTTATTLKTTLAESMQGALQAQLRPGEALQTLPCTPTLSADRHIGQESVSVKVTVSETCSAAAYNTDALVSKATDLVSHQARQQLGTGYSLIGTVQVTIAQATVTHTTATLIFSCQGTWVYALSQQAQMQIKHLIAGKPRQEAIKLLVAMPGIETATVEGDDQTKLPKNLDALHLRIIVPTSYQW
jgi:hypothetical protein